MLFVISLNETLQMQLFVISNSCICLNKAIPINKKLTITQGELNKDQCITDRGMWNSFPVVWWWKRWRWWWSITVFPVVIVASNSHYRRYLRLYLLKSLFVSKLIRRAKHFDKSSSLNIILPGCTLADLNEHKYKLV